MAKKNKKEETNNNDIMAEEQTAPVTEEKAETQEVSAEEQLKEELAKEKDKFLRLFAEFENYKKRTAKERIELFKTAGQDVVSAMLPILDDFDRALAEIQKSGNDNNGVTEGKNELLKGVELINNKFREALKGKGLTEIETTQGDAFDAELHEAITQIPAPSDDLKGKIIDVVEKGYKLGEKIIRYPKVVVGQ
ncbi:nucleotide exchange factor GrpE [Sinomicrobium weinanense]|uniref:Protein GrpE n=1 Tax=Sinomicrobium weinanense TaxID=2842200 RepID=A0A926JRU3_9FLAO|nr:nucleotide exchange factor GrpE [Sinomicrobium weinanense]MBC9796216.1 nucleotide exchange factor GrpE [Sinomicrobium weinanense]MBU3123495.1 nucleotide exchange factor GrpE [Sinomicrobium weinanense]